MNRITRYWHSLPPYKRYAWTGLAFCSTAWGLALSLLVIH